jgi:hypothetical protein
MYCQPVWHAAVALSLLPAEIDFKEQYKQFM